MTRRARRRAIVALTVLSFAALTAQAASCTTFNGLEASLSADGGPLSDASPGEASPPLDACVGRNDGYLTIAEAARTCSWIYRCGLEADLEYALGLVASDTSFSLCMNWMAGPVPKNRIGMSIQQQSLQCVARATSCAQASECLSTENIGVDPRCDGGVPTFRCENNQAVDCTPMNHLALHCGAVLYDGVAQCLADDGGIGCGFPHGSTCATHIRSCDPLTGNLLDCLTGTAIDNVINCRAVGSTCGPTGRDASPRTDCLTGGVYRFCNTSFRNKCNGAFVETCNVNYTVSQIDCAALGKTCAMVDSQPVCVAPGDECTPASLGVNLCSGTSISTCIAGRKVSVDCACGGMICSTTPSPHCSLP